MNKLFDVLSHHKYNSTAKFGSLITFYLVNTNVCWMWQKQSYMWIFYIISIDQTMYSVRNHGAEDCIHVCCGPFYFYSGKYWIKYFRLLGLSIQLRSCFQFIFTCVYLWNDSLFRTAKLPFCPILPTLAHVTLWNVICHELFWTQEPFRIQAEYIRRRSTIFNYSHLLVLQIGVVLFG